MIVMLHGTQIDELLSNPKKHPGIYIGYYSSWMVIDTRNDINITHTNTMTDAVRLIWSLKEKN